MEVREITDVQYRGQWNRLAPHPLQAWEWGDFRKTTGVNVVRYGIFDENKLIEPIQVTIHSLPHTPWSIGYYPKGGKLLEHHITALQEISRRYGCIYIKCEPKVEKGININWLTRNGFKEGRSLFTRYNFILDVTPSEDELLKNMKQKTRYNIKVARKRGVEVALNDTTEAFHRYLQLTKETTERQKFYAHSTSYHTRMWETLTKAGIAHLLAATYEGQIITTWILFQFGDTLYYPYGASTREHRDVMANNLVMWEAIKIAKKWNLHYLDMWGALGPNPDQSDPWYGFHTFKSGYGARHVEYIGTWDYVGNTLLYYPLRAIEWARWKLLRLFK